MLPALLMFVIVAGMLGISFYYLYNAIQASSQGDLESAFYYVLLGSVGLGIAIYVTYILRKRSYPKKPLPRVVTTIECKKCNFKNLRTFKRGDFVFQSVDTCEKCNEPMLITAIYAEKDKDKRKPS